MKAVEHGYTSRPTSSAGGTEGGEDPGALRRRGQSAGLLGTLTRRDWRVGWSQALEMHPGLEL